MAVVSNIVGSSVVRCSAALAATACMLLGPLHAIAQTAVQAAGEVEFSRGVGFAQSAGQLPRTLGKGLLLNEGDRLTTSDTALAVVKLQDGTRMTVRPGSEMVLQQYRFKQDAADNGMVMQLLRGGFRAITGLISKNSPNAARIQTSTATIGIRGTDFDVRLCTKDCAVEGNRISERPRSNQVQASAKVLTTRGELNAIDGAGVRRRLVDGAGVYPGDLVETGETTQAVLAFRDESKVTLGATTRFRIDNFIYDSKNPGEGRYLVSLLRGSLRALSGLIGKSNNRNVGYSTSTATIGIRGTEFSMDCTGACAGESGDGGLNLYTWLGAIAATIPGQTALDLLQAGQGLLITPSGIQIINVPPANPLFSPSTVPTPALLFSSNELNESEGLYVFVRDGHIEIASNRDVLHLGRGEAGYLGPEGDAIRPINIPLFMDFDRLPLPNSQNLNVTSILNDTITRSPNVCR